MQTPATLQRTLQAPSITGISIFALALAFAADTIEATANTSEKPRLVLQVTVDQFRGNLPTRYADRLGEGGLRYLLGRRDHHGLREDHHRRGRAGDDEITDYLGVSSSATDYIGHFSGPSSLESEDNVLQLDEPLEVMGLDRFGENELVIRVRLKTRPIKQWAVGREYRRRLKKAFDAAGVEIPFPQRTVWVRGEGKLPKAG